MNKGTIKRISIIALAALFAASLASCTAKEQGGGGAAQTSAPASPISGNDRVKVTLDPNATPAPVHDLSGYSYQFVRIAYTESANSMEPIVITSTDKLREVITEKLSSGATSRTSAEDYLKQYNEEFFKRNYLLVFNLTFSSGSVVPKVSSVKLENGAVNIVTEGTMTGDVGTADMASHMCLLSLDAERFPENSSFMITGPGTAKSGESRRK